MRSIETQRREAPGPRIVATALVAALVAGLSSFASAGEASADAPLQDFDHGCRVRVFSSPSTTLMRVRDNLSIVTRARFDCLAAIRPFHLTIIADAEAIEAGGAAASFAPALRSLGDRIHLDVHRDVRIGAIDFDSTATTLCDPTGDPDILKECLARLGRTTESPRGEVLALDAAIVEATHRLARIRDDHPDADPPRQMMLILVAPETIEWSREPELTCDNAGRAISAASTLGIESDIVCLSESCRKSCLHRLVDPTRVHRMDNWSDLSSFVVSEAWASELRVRHIAIHERLGDGFSFDVDSPDPSGANYEPASHTLDWRIDGYGRRSIHLSYSLSPRGPGTHTIRDPALGSVAQFIDTRGGVGTFDLGNAAIGVVDRAFFTAFLPALDRPACSLCVRPDHVEHSIP